MSVLTDKTAFLATLETEFREISSLINPETMNQITNLVRKPDPDFWAVANLLGQYYNDHPISESAKNRCIGIINKIRSFQGERAMNNADGTTVVFGTSGWRGVIGEDFTLLNVHKVVRGIIEMMKSAEFLNTNKYTSFTQVREAGVLILKDNRFMGDVFMEAAMKELARENIKIFSAGECPTGVGSAILTDLGAAGSINFTPSHNPMEYAGIKFNPADGGPADTNLTSIIEEKANAFMKDGPAFSPADNDYADHKTELDAAALFESFVSRKSLVFDLERIRSWLRSTKNDLFMVIDFMHGSSRGYIEKLIGPSLVDELKAAGSLEMINTNDDYSFHGVKPEPNTGNQKRLMERLKKNQRRFTLAVALDPDADRIRYADAELDIDMNRFGAIAYAHLLKKGMKGAICSTLPSSDFALEIAKKNGFDVIETPVGFKFFREALKSGNVLLAFEESDGISVVGHTLEKCALAGFLLALDTMTESGKTLSAQYTELQERYGYFYPSKAGADVKGVSVDEWQSYKNKVLKALQHGLFTEGDTLLIGDVVKRVRQINTADGIKLTFTDKSWILLRPSGTEPKFRYYYEIVSETPLPDVDKHMKDYEKAAAEILKRARDQVA